MNTEVIAHTCIRKTSRSFFFLFSALKLLKLLISRKEQSRNIIIRKFKEVHVLKTRPSIILRQLRRPSVTENDGKKNGIEVV